MLLYNVTIKIEEHAKTSWLKWMQETHIPAMLATGKFVHARMCRVLLAEETDGITYAVQYLTPSREMLEKYYEEDANHLRTAAHEQFPDMFVAFRTELEVIGEQSLLG